MCQRKIIFLIVKILAFTCLSPSSRDNLSSFDILETLIMFSNGFMIQFWFKTQTKTGNMGHPVPHIKFVNSALKLQVFAGTLKRFDHHL